MSDKLPPMTLKEVMRREYKRCFTDPIYFMKKYVKIQHPTKGTLQFETYPFQDDALLGFIKHDRSIVLKSRQMGISTLVAGYSLWLMTFHESKDILCLSITQETAKAIVTKVRFGNDNLPSWLKQKVILDNQLSLKLKNGSQIKAVSSSSSSGRSAALSLLIIDEAAFVQNAEELWLSAQSTLSTGGKAIILSTPNGVGNFFHKMWVESEDGGNDFNRVTLPWNLHPERGTDWRENQTKLLGERGAAQECDCVFSTSGNTVIEIPVLDWHLKNTVKEPLEKRGIDRGIWIWEYPAEAKSYMVVADVARGDGDDFSAAQVIDVESMEQVAEYKGRIPTKDYARLLMSISTEYNTALLIIENATVGWAVIQEVIDKSYSNLFYSSSDLQYVDVENQISNKIASEEKNMKPGFTTSSKTRPLIISKMEAYVREKDVIIRSSRLIDEFKVFIWKNVGVNVKAEAMSGYNDDLVMSMGIALWVRDVALRLKNERVALNRAALNSFYSTSVERTDAASSRFGIFTTDVSPQKNPWIMQNGVGESEDLTWLLK
jgi:hypothetical protein